MLRLWLGLITLILLLGSCNISDSEASSTAPPIPVLLIDNRQVAVIQGSYCWSANGTGKCADMIPPKEMMKERNYTLVGVPPKSDGVIKFMEQPVESLLRVSLWDGMDITEVQDYKDCSFTVPDKTGEYLYDFHANWGPGKSSEYHFAIRVDGNQG